MIQIHCPVSYSTRHLVFEEMREGKVERTLPWEDAMLWDQVAVSYRRQTNKN
jgi:hypothetical protein